MFVPLRTHKLFSPRESKIDVYDNGYLPHLSLLYFDASNSKPLCIEFNVLITDIKKNLFLNLLNVASGLNLGWIWTDPQSWHVNTYFRVVKSHNKF